jgi:fermentation-respiration switch protein FrsA (DUF1100 family)
VLLALLIIATVGYVLAALWLFSQEARIVYEAGRTPPARQPSFPYEQIDLPRADGRRQTAWVMQQPAPEHAPWALYFHGNASTVASSVNIAHYQRLRGLGLNILAPEYRGFGGLDGVPTEAGLAEDARAAYDYLRVGRQLPGERIVIYGWSLGAAIAVDLAARSEQGALILEGAPASLIDVVQQRYPLFPMRLLLRSDFDSIDEIGLVRAPILFLHSPDDNAIPIAEARRLYEAARSEKQFAEIPGGHLNVADTDPTRFDAVVGAFLARRGMLAAAPSPSG